MEETGERSDIHKQVKAGFKEELPAISPVRISWNQDFQSVLSGLGVYKEGRTLKN